MPVVSDLPLGLAIGAAFPLCTPLRSGFMHPPLRLVGLYALLLLCKQQLLYCSTTALQSACAVLLYHRIAYLMRCTNDLHEGQLRCVSSHYA